jgi:hypothetical protein
MGSVGNQRQRCGLPREAERRVEAHRLGLKQPLSKEFCHTPSLYDHYEGAASCESLRRSSWSAYGGWEGAS